MSLFLQTNKVTCDVVEPFQGFDPIAYMGTWYTNAHSKNQPYQPDTWVCTVAEYSEFNNDTKRFVVKDSLQTAIGAPRQTITGEAQCPATGAGDGLCHVSLYGTTPFDQINYSVVSTDYTNYSIVY